ncbi:MAG: PTS sugar transporter subunit IIA [Verrucomicrobiota bacterium]|nr:PTS sugar transporter subunit IIA [Verrucomicrobiota bacterium]
MHPVVNHLIQLQELTLIKDEQQAAQRKEHLEKLDEAIKEMTQQLPPFVRDRFTRLNKKDHIVIAPISEGMCAICRMLLPISLAQSVKVGKDVLSCPNCARMLYFPYSAPQWVGARHRRSAPPKAGISRFSADTLMIPKLEAETREGAIRELACKMESEGFVDKAEKLVEAALRREAVVSTGFDHGLAFPHARGVEGGGLTLALGVSRKGIDFDGVGKSLAHIIFFLAIPTAASAFYLKLLAGLTETFMAADARKALLAEKEPEKLWKALVRVTRSAVK